jgi:hypothetical protein
MRKSISKFTCPARPERYAPSSPLRGYHTLILLVSATARAEIPGLENSPVRAHFLEYLEYFVIVLLVGTHKDSSMSLYPI